MPPGVWSACLEHPAALAAFSSIHQALAVLAASPAGLCSTQGLGGFPSTPSGRFCSQGAWTLPLFTASSFLAPCPPRSASGETPSREQVFPALRRPPPVSPALHSATQLPFLIRSALGPQGELGRMLCLLTSVLPVVLKLPFNPY